MVHNDCADWDPSSPGSQNHNAETNANTHICHGCVKFSRQSASFMHTDITRRYCFLQLTISSRVWGYCWGEMTYLSNDPTDVRTIFEIVIYKLKPAALVVTHHRLTGLTDVERKTVFYSTRRYRWVIISSDPIDIIIDICLILQSSVTKWTTYVCHKSQNRINLLTRYRTWRSASLSFVCWQFPVPASEVLPGKYRMGCQVRRIIR